MYDNDRLNFSFLLFMYYHTLDYSIFYNNWHCLTIAFRDGICDSFTLIAFYPDPFYFLFLFPPPP